MAASSCGRRKISKMLVCKAGSVRVVVAARGATVGAGVGVASASGVGVGVGRKAGDGDGEGCVTFRSRCAFWFPGVAKKLP